MFRVKLPTTTGATDVRSVVDPYNAIPERDKSNNDLDKTIEIVAVPTGTVLDPDLTAMEERFKQNSLIPLPDTANSDYHIWQEVRLGGGASGVQIFPSRRSNTAVLVFKFGRRGVHMPPKFLFKCRRNMQKGTRAVAKSTNAQDACPQTQHEDSYRCT